MSQKIVRNRVRCLNCGVILESTFRHEMVMCSCGNGVDGGKDYLKRIGDLTQIQELSEFVYDSYTATNTT